MSNIDKQALTTESARESGNILLIVAARMARRELFTPLHLVSELPQKVVSMRVFREALERSEETLQREVCRIVDGHDRMDKKLKEAESKLEAAEKRIAEMESKNSNLRTVAHEQNELAIRVNLDSISDAVEMDSLYKRIAETDQRNAELTARIEPMDRRIAELERSETQLINERDDAESALNDAYKAVMGQAPEWSNWFSFENAIDEIELACEQWRNQTDDVIQFRQRIAELEAREILLPERSSMLHRTDFHEDYHTVMAYKVSDVIAAIRATGIKVKES